MQLPQSAPLNETHLFCNMTMAGESHVVLPTDYMTGGRAALQVQITGACTPRGTGLRKFPLRKFTCRSQVQITGACTSRGTGLRKFTCRSASIVNASSSVAAGEDVVIVGGGIAGLATALALHRLGRKSVVLEQSEALRVTGTALGVWTNGWKALEALGIADGLREQFQSLSGVEFYSKDGTCLSKLNFPDEVELRAVDRRVLLESLAHSLPPDTIQYNSRVVKLHKMGVGCTQVELGNGSMLQTKVLIGCDGIGSVVAKQMGLGDARYVGYTGIRGMTLFPDGHNFNNTLTQTLGQGVRMGTLPLDSKRVYFFFVFNHPRDKKVADPNLIKEEALTYAEGWPSKLVDLIRRSAPESLSRSAISDRWMWPHGGPKLCENGVTVAGDAMHPVTPNLAQGGCSALEDAVILSRLLSSALGKSDRAGVPEVENVELVMKSYIEQRKKRMFPMAVQAYTIGAVLQIDQKTFCSIRDSVLPTVLTTERFTMPSLFDCGKLA